MITEESFIKILSKKGYRITNSRKDIISCLFDNNHEHTISELINHLKANHNQINVSSIYNTIEILIKEGLVQQQINPLTKEINYEVINPDNNHFHVYDLETEVEYLLNLPKPIKHEIEKFVTSQLGLTLTSFQIAVFAKKNKRKKNEKI
ncbi:MAG: Fur family transcriptional regulator [Mycoplasmoidaceae bacterium]